MSIPLTSRQREIVEFIRQCLARDSRAPTRQEIATHFGFRSINSAEDHLQALARRGAVALDGGTARGIRLLSGPRSSSRSGIPLLGRVAAGQPILAAEHLEDRIKLDSGLFSEQPDFLLRVKGLSMRDAGILDGDLLAVKQSARVQNGHIVVARIDDEVTVKYWHLHGQMLELRAANPDFAALLFDLERTPVELVGHAVGVIRQRLNS